VLQRFLANIAEGETRTLVAGGQIIGSYLRLPTDQLHANLAQHGSAQPTTLSKRQRQITEEIATDLVDEDIGFAAIDLVDDILMEVNVANPGGLGTLNQLYGKDFGPALVRAVALFIQ
jgi:glutathione synthase